MIEDKPRQCGCGAILLAAALFAAAACLFHLVSACAGHPFYRDQHLGAAVHYAQTKIDLLRPIIVGFNATQTPTPQELPLWQAASALVFKLCGFWFGWANVASLVLFFTCLWPLYQIARDYLGPRCAAWTLLFFLAQPVVFVYSGVAGTDGFSLASTIWFFFFGSKLLQRPNAFWWVLAFLSGAVSATSKLPFFLAAGLAMFLLLLRHYRRSLRHWFWLGTVGLAVGLVFAAWTKHTNACMAQAEFPLVDLRLSNPDMVFWYFGDWHYRLSPAIWGKAGWRILNACFGSLVLVGLAGYAVFFSKGHGVSKYWLLGCAVATMIFSHLVLHHRHYYLMFSPAIAMLCAQAVVDFEDSVIQRVPSRRPVWLGAVPILLGLSLVQGWFGMKIVEEYDPYPYRIATLIRKYTSESDRLLVQNGGWGGQQLLLTNRKGLDIWGTEFLEKPANLARIRELGYNKLVMISESPLLYADQVIDPGQAGMVRETYHAKLTHVADGWKTLFQNEDLLIKEIPPKGDGN
jgi:hypothetical protein